MDEEYEYDTVADVLAAHARGERVLGDVVLADADFSGRDLGGLTFLTSSLHAAKFDRAELVKTWFSESELPAATFNDAYL